MTNTGNRSMRLRLLAAAVVLALAPLGQAGAEAPTTVVENFHAALTNVMKRARELGIQGRFDTLASPFDASFDTRMMARITAGGHWRKAEEGLRKNYVEAFRRMSLATYAAQFSGWDGEAFETVEQADGPRGTKVVKTLLTFTNGSPVPLNYVLRGAKDKTSWRIVDVLLDGDISQLAVRRSEYASVLSGGGLGELTAALEKKAEALLEE